MKINLLNHTLTSPNITLSTQN